MAILENENPFFVFQVLVFMPKRMTPRAPSKLSLDQSGHQSDQSSKNAAPNDEPAEVVADHPLDDVLHHLRGEFFEPAFHDDIDAVEEFGMITAIVGELQKPVLKVIGGHDVFDRSSSCPQKSA